MSEEKKPQSLTDIANDFTVGALPQEAAEREDPRSEEGDSTGARLRRRLRSFVMADLGGNMAGKG
jgi:hypothetical protein